MARVKWIEHRLKNWALWKVAGNSGGLGFSSQAAFLAMKVDCSRESPLPVDEIDAEKMDRAVESLKLSGHGHLYKTLQLHYLKGMGFKDVAREMGRAVSTIHAQLTQADLVLQDWFNLENEKRERRNTPLPKPLPGAKLQRAPK